MHARPSRLVLFDVDGTLVDSQTMISTTMATAFAAVGVAPPPPAAVLGDIDTSLLDDAAGLLDQAMGAIDALEALGSMPAISDPTGPLAGILGDTAPAIGQLGSIGAGLRGLLE